MEVLLDKESQQSIMCRTPFDKSFTKSVGVFVSLLYIIAGIVMMAFGISIKATPEFFLSSYGHHGLDVRIITGETIQASAIFMIVVAVVSIITGLFGIICFVFANDICLKIYAALQIFLILLNVVLIIFTACYPPEARLKEIMNQSMIKEFASQDITVDNSSYIEKYPSGTSDYAWAVTQMDTSCCGVDGPGDYLALPEEARIEEIPQFGSRNLSVPLSCCVLNHGAYKKQILDFEGCVNNNSSAVNQKGCYSSVMVYYAYSAVSVYRIAPILILFEFALTFLAIKFIGDMKKYEILD